MRNRIYLEDSELALKAEGICHKQAKQKGFNNWWGWYNKEKKNINFFLRELPSFKFMLGVTKRLSSAGV